MEDNEDTLSVLLYTHQILLNSGASDHLINDSHFLSHLEEILSKVILPDGNLAKSFYHGTFQI